GKARARRVRPLATPAVAHHEPLQRRPPVGTILAVRPAHRDDRRALDIVGNAEDFVDARLAPAVQRREYRSEPEGPRRQHEVLHARVDRRTGLEPGLAGGRRGDAGDDQPPPGPEPATAPARPPPPVP